MLGMLSGHALLNLFNEFEKMIKYLGLLSFLLHFCNNLNTLISGAQM